MERKRILLGALVLIGVIGGGCLSQNRQPHVAPPSSPQVQAARPSQSVETNQPSLTEMLNAMEFDPRDFRQEDEGFQFRRELPESSVSQGVLNLLWPFCWK
jgi:hypothetical protein